MERHPDLTGALQSLFSDYADGFKDYDTYAKQVRALQAEYPEQFAITQAQNTRAKEWMLNNLQFETDKYFDDWSQAGLNNLRSGNLDVPYGHEQQPMVIEDKTVRGAYGNPEWFPEAGRTFIQGDPVTQRRYASFDMPALLRHEGSHGVVQGESEAAVRKMDAMYDYFHNARPTPNAPSLWDTGAEIFELVTNVGPEHTSKKPYQYK